MSTAGNYSLTWNLNSLLPHPETNEFRADLQQFRCDLGQLAERSEHLPAVGGDADNVNEWVEFLAGYESLAGRARDLNAFVGVMPPPMRRTSCSSNWKDGSRRWNRCASGFRPTSNLP